MGWGWKRFRKLNTPRVLHVVMAILAMKPIYTPNGTQLDCINKNMFKISHSTCTKLIVQILGNSANQSRVTRLLLTTRYILFAIIYISLREHSLPSYLLVKVEKAELLSAQVKSMAELEYSLSIRTHCGSSRIVFLGSTSIRTQSVCGETLHIKDAKVILQRNYFHLPNRLLILRHCQ